MTRKSEARLKRDALAKEMKEQGVTSPYAELEGMYQTQCAMFGPYYDMAKIMINPEVTAFLDDVTHTHNLVRGLAADVKDLWKRTEGLHTKHAGINKMPDAINEDENWEIIQMFQEYQVFYGVHTQTILPIMLQLDEHLQVALRKKEAAQAAAIAAATAGNQTDLTTTPAETVNTDGATVLADGVSNSEAVTMASYEAAATTN